MKDIIFLDTETTDVKNGRLVELAVKCPSFCGGQLLTFLFKPPVPITPEAMAVHHITNSMVKTFQSFADSDQRAIIQDLIRGKTIVAHNAPFDAQILKNEGLDLSETRFICTLKLSRRLYDFTSYKLDAVRYGLGIEEIPGWSPHSAGGDVLVLEEIFKYIYRKVEMMIQNNDPNEVLAELGCIMGQKV